MCEFENNSCREKVTNLSCSSGKREEEDKGKNMSKEIANIVYSCKNILKIIQINSENKKNCIFKILK